MKKICLLFLTLILCFSFCACDKTSLEADTTSDANSETETIDEYTGLKTVTFDNLKGKFVAFKHIIQPHAFTQEDNVFSGNIVFTHGESSVPVTFTLSDYTVPQKPVLTIDNQSIELNLPEPYGIDVVDLDMDDNRYEIAVYDMGYSGDFSISFFSYIDGDIIELGVVDANKDAEVFEIGPSSGVALCDMHGTIVDPWYYVRLGEPGTVLKYEKLTEEGMVTKTLDVDLTGKTYTVEEGFPCFFKAMEYEPNANDLWSENVYFNFDCMMDTVPGDTFKILIPYPSNNTYRPHWTYLAPQAYYVEYNGQTGLLYLMLGD